MFTLPTSKLSFIVADPVVPSFGEVTVVLAIWLGYFLQSDLTKSIVPNLKVETLSKPVKSILAKRTLFKIEASLSPPAPVSLYFETGILNKYHFTSSVCPFWKVACTVFTSTILF